MLCAYVHNDYDELTLLFFLNISINLSTPILIMYIIVHLLYIWNMLTMNIMLTFMITLKLNHINKNMKLRQTLGK